MSLAVLPYDLLVDQILPVVSLSALLALTCTSKNFACACSDPVLWRRMLQRDFCYFPSANTVLTVDFKTIFRGIYHPEIYIWGHLGHGRRGSEDETTPFQEAFSRPVQLKMKRRIVSLVAGGWFFQALDGSGVIHAWGTMNPRNDISLSSDNPSFSDAGSRAGTPIQLQLPTRFVSISCGRNHSAALDSQNRVWFFMQWGRPFILTFTGSLDGSTRHSRILSTRITQVVCGHMPFITFLTDDGQVYLIWATRGLFSHQAAVKNAQLDREGDGHPGKSVNGIVSCVPIPISAEPLLLPPLPLDLPNLHRTDTQLDIADETIPSVPRLIEITAGNNFIIGLTDQGHVLCINVIAEDSSDGIDDLRHLFASGGRQWVYLPQFCDIAHIVDDPVFLPRENEKSQVSSPTTVRITHVSAYWKHFVVHSTEPTSLVMVATMTAGVNSVVEFSRCIKPSLQNKRIISVQAGCDHYVALDVEGKVMAWGLERRGTLGLGDPNEWKLDNADGDPQARKVDQPTSVSFDNGRFGGRKFCFSISASGWHTGALVFNLDGCVGRRSDDDVTVPSRGREEGGSVEDQRLSQKSTNLKNYFSGLHSPKGFGWNRVTRRLGLGTC